jgi:hypothetical protein
MADWLTDFVSLQNAESEAEFQEAWAKACRRWCDISGGGFNIGPDTSIEVVLTQICKIISGCVGEFVLDPDGVREASSLDEVVISQVMANNLTLKIKHRNGREIWDACWRRTAHVIKKNETEARELLTKLAKTETLRRTPLAQSLAKVRQVPGASVGDLFLAGGAP